ncbi:YybH family protein [Fulvivirga sedimenti]|uniref:Nuclear transport factor 2 family protein n=1 Tax=Fulvivirga sedimenti TaxID=2879465 RepID=A0A9X1HNJ8_9BACT|nr:nuclear transport factor 2 family protein [Fulvivirga sedimenti]MCA6073887.1 nuclear transport factor 2 family protein [Fulvivirga sedimenti]
MKHKGILLIVIWLLLLARPDMHAQLAPVSIADKQAISDVMTAQQNAWNKGNIEVFMEGYWKSDSLLFVGATGPIYGWQTTLTNYLERYPDRTSMGELNFEISEIRILEQDHARLLGKFHLKRTIGDVSGYFTLIFYRFPDGWKIISDQTSAGN